MKKSFIFFFAFVPFLLVGCNSTDNSGITENTQQTSIPSDLTSDNPSVEKTDNNDNSQPMTDFDQTALPEKGEEIVSMETSMGSIKIRLFPQFAPKTVENFVGLAEKGYYDGLTFHRVMENFMIQGGDPTGTGAGGESLWGGKFANEISMDLSNIRGSLAMANAGKDTNGSQFFINQVDNTYLNGYEGGQMKACAYPESCHTVFGQVFEGMDVVDKIAAVQTGTNDKPVEDVKMVKVTIEKY